LKGSGDFSIGSKHWPGVSKLVEECAEVLQVCGKLMGTAGERQHWDGTDLKKRLEEEIADMQAAAVFVTETCNLDVPFMNARRMEKLGTFRGWHQAGDPPPSDNYKCVVCRVNWVNAKEGYDTCPECLRKL